MLKNSRRKARKKQTFEEIPIIVVDPPSMDNNNSAGIDKSEETCLNVEPASDEDEVSEMRQDEQRRRSSLRRNSVSLPNLDDLEAFRNNVPIDTPDLEDDTDSDPEIPPTCRTPLRNARRKSVSSPKMLKPPGDEEYGSNSPANSITSINSLASLLREKMQMLPATLRKQKTPDYKTRIFVCLLFITIVVLIFCAYFLYHQKVLQRSYFEKMKFNKIQRIIKIYNNDGLELVHGRLGTTISYDKALPCLPQDERHDGSICSEWMGRARLYLKYHALPADIKCYTLDWLALHPAVLPTDCFDISQPNDHWYGGGQTAEPAWPLAKGGHAFAPFITGRVDRHQYGNILKRYFISSKGVAITVDDDAPLYVSIAEDEPKQLCLRAQFDDFAYVNHLTPLPRLNYTICTAGNMTTLHSTLIDDILWDGLKPEEMNVVNSLLTEPLWEITATNKEDFTEEIVQNYTGNSGILGPGFLKQGHVLLNAFWQNQIGDFEVDTDRFPTLENAIKVMQRRGFRVVFTIQPFISTESFNFREAVNLGLFVFERANDKRIPALTQYKSLKTAGLLDITNNKTGPWLLAKLKGLAARYSIDAFYLDLGTAFNLPRYFECEKQLTNPDQYKTHFINALQNSVSLFGVSGAIERPRTPAFVSLPEFESSWEGLRTVIPAILTYGILGYPFLLPGAVGGDYKAPGNYTSELLPDKELYVRWLQLASFLPVVRYTHLPSTYDDERVMEMAKILTKVRQEKVTPLLKAYAKISLDTGLPLVRPLWMLDNSDQACHLAVDEFAVGNDLIVAPVLYQGAREREIYLPAGVWRDGIDSGLRKGSRWIHDYRVEEDQVAFFEKMPDDTRF